MLQEAITVSTKRMVGEAETADLLDDDTEFDGIEIGEFEAIAETALNIPPERAAAIRAEFPE